MANGFTVVYHFFRKRMVLQMGFLLCFLVLNLVHTDVMPNDMYTANAATLDTMSTIRVPEKSIIITTNANYLQTRYSIVGHDYTIAQEGAAVFTATNAKSANTAALNWGTGQPVYVLISLYQLRQHPSQMAFWNNSAIPNTRVNDFTDPQYFQTIIRDDNILFVRALPQ